MRLPPSPASGAEVGQEHELSLEALTPAQNLRVLIVEDEPMVACFIREIFATHCGCSVDLAATGLAAFELLAGTRYALVVSDVRMPEMDGAELYLWLREAQPSTAQSFVFVTAHAEESRFGQDLARWGVPVIDKPFTKDQLLAVCRPYLGHAAALAAR